MQVPQFFAAFFAREPFAVQKKVADLLASFLVSFWHSFGGQKIVAGFLPSFSEKRTVKSRQGYFLRQKVAMKKRLQKVVALQL